MLRMNLQLFGGRGGAVESSLFPLEIGVTSEMMP